MSAPFLPSKVAHPKPGLVDIQVDPAFVVVPDYCHGPLLTDDKVSIGICLKWDVLYLLVPEAHGS